MKVLICGDRDWNDYALIQRTVQAIHAKAPITRVIEGEARGADSIGRDVALGLGITVDAHRALWRKHGKAAGPIRNRQMLNEGKPDLVLAFHDDIENSKGTKDMVSVAREAGVKVQLVSHKAGPAAKEGA